MEYESSLVGRRKLLESLRGKGKRRSDEEPSYLPFARDALVKSGSALQVSFPRPNINDSCNGCSGAEPLCVKLCPSGTLTKLEKEKELPIEVKPDLYSGCGICKDVCPASRNRENLQAGLKKFVEEAF